MRSKAFSNFAVTLSFLLLVGTPQVSSQTISEEAPVLVEALAKQLVARKRTKVAAVDFTDIQGRPNELGRFLADQLSIEMVMAEGLTVIDRANLNAIMAEHKLTAEGLVDPANAKKLGQFSGVEAILVGNLTTMDGAVMLTVRAISTDTSELVAAGRMRIAMTDDVRRMLGLSVSGSSRNVATTAAGPTAATAITSGNPLAPPVSVGPLVATVKDLSYGLVGDGPERHPQIRVTIEFENRNLNASVAIAANSQVLPGTGQRGQTRSPETGVVFGDLQDASGTRWIMGQGSLRGVPVVYGFETTAESAHMSYSDRITQNAPSNIVDYVRRGVEYDGSGLKNATQRYWAGSFSSIEPGGRLEVTAVFVPSEAAETTGRSGSGGLGGALSNRLNRGAQSQTFTRPTSLDLSLELVLATLKEGERPERASDLALRNLIINRLVLPPTTDGRQ